MLFSRLIGIAALITFVSCLLPGIPGLLRVGMGLFCVGLLVLDVSSWRPVGGPTTTTALTLQVVSMAFMLAAAVINLRVALKLRRESRA